MRRIFSVIVALGLMVLFATTVDAQGQDQQGGARQGRQGRGGQGRGGQQGRGGRQFGGGQPGGRQFGGRGGGGGMDYLALASLETVQKELDMIPEQAEDVSKAREELRNEARQRGGGNRDFRNMSEEERAKLMEDFRKRAAEQAKKSEAKAKDILFPEQFERLEQIWVQTLGVNALSNEKVAGKLKIDSTQKKKIEEQVTKNREELMSQMREMFAGGGGGGDRESLREKMTELNKENEKKVLAVLSSTQKKDFEKMKGKPFEMPQGRNFFGGGGRGGQGGPGGRAQGGRGGRGGGRPQRDDGGN